MQRDRPFFVPKPGHKPTDGEKNKKGKAPGSRLNWKYLRGMDPLPEPRAQEVKPRPQPQTKPEPLGKKALEDAVAKLMGTGRLKQHEEHYAQMIVVGLAESMGRIFGAPDLARPHLEETLGLVVDISLHYKDPLRVLTKFTDTYSTIALLGEINRTGRKLPVRLGAEKDAEKILWAFSQYTRRMNLAVILDLVKRETKDGISAYEMKFVCPEMLRRISGEAQGETYWGKVPDSPYFHE
ncbi:MAG: hypothetical protein PHQ80_03810 [Candidatus ainarchaeum sp.]|nr:hypothetical protein [Candidatus ainarchaeum sp.]